MKKCVVLGVALLVIGVVLGICSYFNDPEWQIVDVENASGNMKKHFGLILYVQDLRLDTENPVPIGIPISACNDIIAYFEGQSEQDLVGSIFWKRDAIKSDLPEILKKINKLVKEEREKQRMV